MVIATLYEIVNTQNGMRYVGVTTGSLNRRWHSHLFKLRRGKYPEKFQSDFNKYGESAFRIQEICKGDVSEMFRIENETTKLESGNLYNCIVGGVGSDAMKMANSIFKKKLRDNPLYKKEFYEKVAEGNRGKKMSDEARKKMSLVRRGKKWKEWRKDNRSKAYSGSGNPNYGKHRMYLNLQTGIYYSSVELTFLLGKTIHSIRGMFQRKKQLVSNFVKV